MGLRIIKVINVNNKFDYNLNKDNFKNDKLSLCEEHDEKLSIICLEPECH